MTTINLNKELTIFEVQEFFSGCREFEVTQHDKNGTIRINLKVTDTVDYKCDSKGEFITPLEPIYTYKNIDTLIYRPTVQTLIRDIVQLGYRQHAELNK